MRLLPGAHHIRALAHGARPSYPAPASQQAIAPKYRSYEAIARLPEISSV